jgi:hypothetical protein
LDQGPSVAPRGDAEISPHRDHLGEKCACGSRGHGVWMCDGRELALRSVEPAEPT